MNISNFQISRNRIMLRKIISIFFYISAGFFIYGVCLIAFVNIPQDCGVKFLIMGIFSIPVLLCLFIASAVSSFQNWKYYTGVTLLSGVGFNTLVIITIICLLLTPELNEFFPDNKLGFFNDYISGFSVMFILGGTGGFMIKE